jgi:uncharacterized glyoxalase superfamily protein PhnB
VNPSYLSSQAPNYGMSAIQRLGVEVSELRDQAWGERNFQFVDPDGYPWLYGQTLRSSG